MKKTIIISVILCLLLTLSACTGQGTKTEQSNVGDSSQTQEDKGDSGVSDSDYILPAFDKTVTISETVLSELNNVKITATALNYTNYSVELQLKFENQSDKKITVLSGTAAYSCNSINGYMVNDGYLNCDVAAGATVEDEMSFSYNELILYGISQIADIEVGFEIEDEEYNSVYTGPVALKTAAASTYDYTEDTYIKAIKSSSVQSALNDFSLEYFSEDNLYSEYSVNMLSQALIVNKDNDRSLALEFENKGTQMIAVRIVGLKINGLTVDSSTVKGSFINTEKRGILSFSLDNYLDSFKDSLSIDEIGTVEFGVELLNADYKTISNNKTVSLTLSDHVDSFNGSGEEIYSANGIKIDYMGITEDKSSYFNNIHINFLIENSSSKSIVVDAKYDSLSVNGKGSLFSSYSKTIEPGSNTAFDIELWDPENISSAAEITEVKFSLEIRDTDYNVIDEPVITVAP